MTLAAMDFGAWVRPLLDAGGAFDHRVTRVCLGIIVGALVLTPVAVAVLRGAKLLDDAGAKDVWVRLKTWAWLAPAIVLPIVWCRLGAVVVVTLLAILAYREFARGTGLFRYRALSALVALAILTMAFAALDGWRGLFVAVGPMCAVVLAGVAVLRDEPKGYLQRVALAMVGLMLFGVALMHLAYLTNAANYRPILLMLLVCTQVSDIAAYICGKALGVRHLFPNTSPKKTIGGHVGSLVVTAALAATLAHWCFLGSAMDVWSTLILFGLLVALGAQLGDLVLGSIKRDLGVKDLATTLAGHGGFTDRVNSMLLVAPAAYYFLTYVLSTALVGG